MNEWIKLNVGGVIYQTTRTTLLKNEDTMLFKMFSENDFGVIPGVKDEQTGAILIDRNGRYFEPILNYLRTGQLIYDTNLSLDGILEEARYFGVQELVEQLQNRSFGGSPVAGNENIPLTRQDVIRALIQTSYKSELRFQGVNLTVSFILCMKNLLRNFTLLTF